MMEFKPLHSMKNGCDWTLHDCRLCEEPAEWEAEDGRYALCARCYVVAALAGGVDDTVAYERYEERQRREEQEQRKGGTIP